MKQSFTKLIKADPDAFYMSCPEIVGKHIAQRLHDFGFKTAIELCCAVGALTVQLAQKLDFATGIDIDLNRIESAKYNAALYGVEDKTAFIRDDVLDENILKKWKLE